MPRIRSIKPEFFTSLTIADLSDAARLTFIGLWTYVDDHGRGIDDARLVKAAVWPLDVKKTEKVVAGLLDELEKNGRILRYRVAGRAYLCVQNWTEHQRVDKPQKPKHPGPFDDPSGNVPGTVGDDSTREQGAGSREQSSSSDRRERSGNEEDDEMLAEATRRAEAKMAAYIAAGREVTKPRQFLQETIEGELLLMRLAPKPSLRVVRHDCGECINGWVFPDGSNEAERCVCQHEEAS